MKPTAAPVLTDERIAELLAMPKIISRTERAKLGRLKQDGAHERTEANARSATGEQFVVWVRRNRIFQDNWSVGLRWVDAEGRSYRLLRANGPHPSIHRNKIEGDSFDPCHHLHRATEHYQEAGHDIDAWAQPTDAFNSLPTAILWLTREASLLTDGMETLL